MNPDRGQEVYANFHAALNCDPAQRVALLEELSASDPELRAELERLLSQDAEAQRDHFLTVPDSMGRLAPGGDVSTDAEADFQRSESTGGTGAETPVPATALPPGLAEHPD
jgi:hypothetical protein